MGEAWVSKLKSYFDGHAINSDIGDDDLVLNGYKAPHVTSYWTEPVREGLLNDIMSKLMLSKNHHILDVGCGTGMVLRRIALEASRIVGVDFSMGMLGIARDRCPPHAALFQANGVGLPFKRGMFDRVLCYHVITNFPDDKFAWNVLRELVRVTRKGGFVFIGNTPDFDKKDGQAKLVREQSHGQSRPVFSESLLQRLEARFRRIGYVISSHPGHSVLSNRFYTKEFFRHFAEQSCCDIEILPLEVEGYLYAPCRFDVRLWPL